MNIRRLRFSIYLLALQTLLLTGCHSQQPDANPGLPITHMRLDSQDFTMEIAASDHSRQVGLMHRDQLPSDHGMLFVFDKPQEQWFWNHDVRFPLDVVFLDGNGAVVSVIHMNAYSDLDVSSNAAAKYAIELNAGAASRLHLDIGTHLIVPPEADSALSPDK